FRHRPPAPRKSCFTRNCITSSRHRDGCRGGDRKIGKRICRRVRFRFPRSALRQRKRVRSDSLHTGKIVAAYRFGSSNRRTPQKVRAAKIHQPAQTNPRTHARRRRPLYLPPLRFLSFVAANCSGGLLTLLFPRFVALRNESRQRTL